ncbi:MAG: VWA domain-containing protein [Muribaculaceae bacterium]|nr:VWA domain-containing protein [Muribaculaceae bacterium]
MKQKVFNLIILDESGSMSSIEKQAIDGVNETVQTIRSAQKKHEEQEHFVTFVSFNSDAVKTVYDKVEVSKVREITDKDYCPSCSTPLYDAMGISLNALSKSVADDDVVLVTIITDGYENASREYNGQAIKSLVESLKAKGWIFTYIGANQDVEKFASTISITNTLSFSADAEGTSAMFAREGKARHRLFGRLAKNSGHGCRCRPKPRDLADDYFAEDEQDDK